mgnify:CR=1 FL=1
MLISTRLASEVLHIMLPNRATSIAYVGWADFLQRVRSRRLLVILVVIAYFGYQLNVGTFELLYQDTVAGETISYRGEPTSAYVGLSTGVTGATILLFFGYYILSGSIMRDRSTGVNELVASTSIRNVSYLLGKWLSHVGMVIVLLATLGGAALVNHLVHGAGMTNPLWILGAVFLVGLPLGCFVAGVTIFFQSSDKLNGTLGNVVYIFGALTLLIVILAAGSEQESGAIPLWLRLGDLLGLFAAGEMTFDALLAVAPEYSGPPVANYGTGSGEVVRYHWDGGSWPQWFYINRFGVILLGIGLVFAATVPYKRFAPGGESERRSLGDRLKRIIPSLFPGKTVQKTEIQTPAEISMTPVTDRASGGFGRLLIQELRLLVRGYPWWWYIGALIIGIVGLSGGTASGAIVSIAAIWPLFVWSGMGYRTVQHRITPLIVSSKQPLRQLIAEWMAGALMTAAFLGATLWPTIVETSFDGILVLAGVVLFVPSLAQALGLWSQTRRVFELIYLVLWYIGPLNGVPALDFAGSTSETAGTATPLVFAITGTVLFLGAVVHRYLQA